MEKIVETVMRQERHNRHLDRAMLTLGALSLCLAILGTLAATPTDIATDTPPSTVAAV